MEHLQQKSLSYPELASFCGEMGMILRSGISALEGLELLMEDTRNDAERTLLDTMYQSMQSGGTFADALNRTGVFPSYLIHMTAIGEETGRLDDVMESLSAHYQREESLSRSIRSSLSYPLIMIILMLVVIVILITKVMPVFQQVFVQLGTEMTGLSKGILLLGSVLSRYALVFVILIAAVIAAGIVLTRTEKGRHLAGRLGHRFRHFREITDCSDSCRFAGAMALALKSGLTPERGLEFSRNLIENPFYLKRLDQCCAEIEQGTEFSSALVKTKVFTGVYARMTAIAGKSGMMDEVMEQIADRCEEELKEHITSFLAVLEPTLVIILSVIVGIILLSVMLPLLGIMAGL